MELKRHFYNRVEYSRLVLMILAVLTAYSSFTGTLSYLPPLLNFSYCALFAFYGYFVLSGSKSQYKRSIKSLATVFIILAVTYFALSLVYGLISGLSIGEFVSAYITKRSIFNFLVLNYWPFPVGSNIWVIQSALYAMVIFYLLDEIDLLKKIEIPLCVILFILAFFLGDGAKIINFNILDYTYIPGNFLTRAMPYMLLGRIYLKNKKKFTKQRNLLTAIFSISGIALVYLEIYLLMITDKFGYYNHLLGFIPITLAILLFSFYRNKDKGYNFKYCKTCKTFYSVIFFTYEPLETLTELFFKAIFDLDQMKEQSLNLYKFILNIRGPVAIILAILIGLAIESIMNKPKAAITEGANDIAV